MESSNYENLFKYIDYFKDPFIVFYNWKRKPAEDNPKNFVRYPAYEGRVRDFIVEILESDLIDNDFQSKLEDVEEIKFPKLITEAELPLVKAIISYYIKGERFEAGSWVKAIDNRIFLNGLLRLKELL